MSLDVLHRHREVWRHKPVLRRLYAEWYREMVGWLVPGRTVEVGGGTGNLKDYATAVCCTDIVALPWLNVVSDAQRLPFAGGSIANLVLFDALHHIENVALFFDEALRTLRPRGRIIIVDPYISWTSWPVYRFLHPEPVDLRQDPLQVMPPRPDRRPFDSNQAIATILFETAHRRFQSCYPKLRLLHLKRFAFFAYPLSGGFDHPSLLPSWAVTPMLKLEKKVEGLGRQLGFRILVVLEHQP